MGVLMKDSSKREIIKCEGTIIDTMYVPPFRLCEGEIVSFQLPRYVARSPTNRRRSWWSWSRDSPQQYLIREFGLSSSLASQIVRNLSLTRFRNFGLLPQGPRTLLAVAGALSVGLPGCVFTSDGLDVPNRTLVYEYVRTKSEEGKCSIELSFPFVSDTYRDSNQNHWHCHPHATSIVVVTLRDGG